MREALRHNHAVAVENLNGLVNSVRELPKEHRVKLILLSYRRLIYWIEWQAEKHGVPVIEVDPRRTSTQCPRCGSRLKENGYRRMKCTSCGFEEDRDTVAVLNIEKRALSKMGGASDPRDCPADEGCSPGQTRGAFPQEPSPFKAGRRSD